ncbi:choice-of-anchor P family protein [Nocardioides sp.]|uniref:choice-of-anchor P family protein n=1 Tax=Nocardioides sp. TaxID=35761 RepID=UPI0026093107|nr:choice-of-anchor P family protein [Nocardioides sp.]
MKSRLLLVLAVLSVLGAALALVPPANAAGKLWAYQASAGGTYVRLGDGTVSSDLTAASTISGGTNGAKRSNSTAKVDVAKGVVSTGAVQTRTVATKTENTTLVQSWARTANVDLLGGLVTIDAVTTTMQTKANTAGDLSSSANTQFAGIHIAGVKLPINIPKNYRITIPGVADVQMNAVQHGQDDSGSATIAWALSLTLLEPREGMPANVTILVNPETQFLSNATPSAGAVLYGMAYGTQATANASDLATIESSPTAFLGTPFDGSHGNTLTRTTATVNIPALLTTGAVTTTSTSEKDTLGNADIRNTSKVAGLSLLGGLIKATAIHVMAHGNVQDGKWTSGMTLSTVGLVIAGQKIPIDVGPNTVINVAGLGKVEINARTRDVATRTNEIAAIRITLGQPKAGLKVGAVIEVGVAATQIS